LAYNLKKNNNLIITMSEWTREAALAIELCEQWVSDECIETPCQLFLFGSAIYKNGAQFDPVHSDLDIVCLFKEQGDALTRFGVLKKLYSKKKELELKMIPILGRIACDEPGVSIVAITPLELHANIHKSGARSFFDRNMFYNLATRELDLGIAGAGTVVVSDEYRQAMEFVQKTRNEYLSVSANDSGGIRAYRGADPLPKVLLRSAAQMEPEAQTGEWYDTRLGLELMHRVLLKRRSESPDIKVLFDDKVSVRRGGRGLQDVALSADDQLLLAELLFDVCSTVHTTDIATWEIRLVGPDMTEPNIERLQASIRRIVPDAKFIGKWPGSVILRVRSSRDSYQLIAQLSDLGVLPSLLKVEAVELNALDGVGPAVGTYSVRQGGRLEVLLRSVSEWLPPSTDNSPMEMESSFAKYLMTQLQSPALLGANVYRDVGVDGHPNDLEFDFLLSWPDSHGDKYERVAIELTRAHSVTSFTNKILDLVSLGMPVILVVLCVQANIKRLEEQISRLALLNANITVVLKVPQISAEGL
jgi:hypothetical protein